MTGSAQTTEVHAIAHDRERLNTLLLHCCYLQMLDLLTTIAFLAHGVQEANPLVRLLITATGSHVAGLLGAKLVGVLMGLYSWQSQRAQLLNRINYLFACLIVWNLLALILGPQ